MNFNNAQPGSRGKPSALSPVVRGGKSLSQKVLQLVNLDRAEGHENNSPSKWKHLHRLSGSVPTMLPFVSNTETTRVSCPPENSTSTDLIGDMAKGIHVGMSNEHQEIEQIRKKLEKYEEDMCKMTLEMTRLRQINESHKQSFEDLNKAVQTRHLSIEEVLQQTQKALQEQTNLLSKQDYVIQKLMEERRRHNTLTELGFLLFGLYLARSPVMKYTVFLLYSHLVTHRKSQKWVLQYLQIFAVFNVYFFARLANDKLAISDRLLEVVYGLSKMTQLGLGNLSFRSVPAAFLRRQQATVRTLPH